jgi:uncharacterized membrane protein YkvA (DUF1232 family)
MWNWRGVGRVSPGPVPDGGSLRAAFHIPNFIRLYARLFRDPRVPWYAKAVLLAAVAYFIVPMDAIADVLVGFGQIDDIIVLVLGLKGFLALCPKNVVEEHVRLIDQRK